MKRHAHNAKRDPDARYTDRKRSVDRDYWHRAGGGYVKARRRKLAAERADVMVRLDELEQEAAKLVPQP